jgi:DHA3 family tetracycline resistance protein-like MFS transporter
MKQNSAYRYYLIYKSAWAFFYALMNTVASLYYIKNVGMSPFQLLMVGFVVELGYFLFEIPAGIVADLYSRKLSMAIGSFLLGCGFLVMALFPSFSIILLAQIIWAMGATFVSGADNAWITDEMKGQQLESVFLRGTQLGYLFTFLGMICSVGLAVLSLPLPIFLSGVLFAGFAFVIYFFFPETNFRPNPNARKAPWKEVWSTFQSGIRVARSHQILGMTLLISFVYGAYSEGIDRLWTYHLLKSFPLPDWGHFSEIYWVGLVQTASMILSFIAVEWVHRRWTKTGQMEKVWILLIIDILTMGAILTFATSQHFALAFTSYLFIQMFRGLNQPIFLAWTNEQIKESQLRATLLSTQSQLHALGEVLGGPFIGFIVLFTSIRGGLITSGLLLTAALWIYRKAKQAQEILPENRNF